MADEKDTHDVEDAHARAVPGALNTGAEAGQPHLDSRSRAAIDSLRRLARWATGAADALEDSDDDDPIRDVIIAQAFALARYDLNAPNTRTDTPTAKRRIFLRALGLGAAALRGAAPDRGRSPSEQLDDAYLARRADRVVDYVIARFAEHYPEEAASLDRRHLRDAVLGFNDTTRDHEIGKDKAILLAIERTTFGNCTPETLKTERSRVRENR